MYKARIRPSASNIFTSSPWAVWAVQTDGRGGGRGGGGGGRGVEDGEEKKGRTEERHI